MDIGAATGAPTNNVPQRVILTLYLLALVVVAVWVPWEPAPVRGEEEDWGPPAKVLNYGFVWSPPVIELAQAGRIRSGVYKRASVDMERVALEILGLTSLCVVSFVLSPGFRSLAEWMRRNVTFTWGESER